LLEQETADLNFEKFLKIKKAAEFTDQLNIHPNHLIALLKRAARPKL
jgi:hypothetical protein